MFFLVIGQIVCHSWLTSHNLTTLSRWYIILCPESLLLMLCSLGKDNFIPSWSSFLRLLHLKSICDGEFFMEVWTSGFWLQRTDSCILFEGFLIQLDWRDLMHILLMESWFFSPGWWVHAFLKDIIYLFLFIDLKNMRKGWVIVWKLNMRLYTFVK